MGIVNVKEQALEEAIEFIMEFYTVTRDIAVELYWDEIEAYMKLFGVENGPKV